jgi:hypothetical protein
MEIRLKTNIKNKPTYLEPEKIEFGHLKKNESLYYYFDYNFDEELWNFQDLYLNNKGNVKMQVAIVKGIYEGFLLSYNTYDIDYDEEKFILNIDGESGNNHIKIYHDYEEDPDYDYQPIAHKYYIKVSLDETEENNNIINDNLFTIYRHTQSEKNGLFVELNSNMYGYFYKYNNEFYYFYTDIRNLQGDLIISLNCEICNICIKDKNSGKCQKILTSSTIIPQSQLEGDYLYYYISGEEGYYYFSISSSDQNSLRYLEQLESELCYKSCKFILPLHNFYNYTTINNTNQTQIIFFVHDYDKVNISYYLTNMSEFENDDIEKLSKEGEENNMITLQDNKLIFELNVNDIMDQEKYLFIDIKSEGDNIFNFLTNEFITSRNLEDIKHLRNIVFMDKTETTKNNILSLQDDFLYKISLYLIDGNGKISLDNSGKYEYNLNYESQTSISLFIKLPKFNISSTNFESQKNFSFLIDVIKVAEYDKIEEKLDIQKTYKVIYFRDEKVENNRIFPINIKVSTENQDDKILFVNYRFIELEMKEKRNDFYNTNDEGFTLILGMNDCSFHINESNYYPEYRRGFLFLEIPPKCQCSNVTLELNKNSTNPYVYEKVFLEVTPTYVSKAEKNDLETIYIPKNTYLQLDINKTTNLVFSEPNEAYDIIKIEIANNTKLNITNRDKDFYCNNSVGKIICSPKKEKMKKAEIIS